MTSIDSKPTRLPAMDTLRTLAIARVLMSHCNGFVSYGSTFGVVGNINWAGIDLFLVLSDLRLPHVVSVWC